MRFQFTARVEMLGYATNAQVEDQAKARIVDPDLVLLALEIGTWEEVHDGWETTVVAVFDDGRSISPEPGHPVIWP